MATIPSIAMIPSGYKANKVYSVLPTDGSGDLITARTTTATRVNSDGLIETVLTGVPRLDYTDGGCPSLLLEPASTNLITYSEDFDNWLKSNTTIDSNVEVSPDGETNATRLNFSTSGSSFIRFITASGDPDGKSFTNSIYLKSDTSNSVEIVILGSGGGLGSSTETLTLSNEWQRFDISQTFSGTGDNVRFRILATEVGSIFAWGGQSEEQSYATSYIKTSGTTISRTADSASKSGISSLINSSEGVFYAEISALSNDLSDRMIALYGSNATNHVRIYYTTSTNKISVAVKSNDLNQYVFLNHNVTDITNYIKIAVKYKANDFATFINGVKVNSQTTTASTPIGLTELAFDDGSGSEDFYGKVKDLRIYKTILSDSELTTLTTI